MLRSLVVALSVLLVPGAALASDPEHGLYITLDDAQTSKGLALFVGPEKGALQMRTDGLKVTLDGQPVGNATITVNGVPMVQDKATGTYAIKQSPKNPDAFKKIVPGVLLQVVVEAAGKAASVTSYCPTQVMITSPVEHTPLQAGETVKVTYAGPISQAEEMSGANVRIVRAEKPPGDTRPSGGLRVLPLKSYEMSVEAKVPRGEASGYLLAVALPSRLSKSADGQLRCTTVTQLRLPAAQ